MNIVCNSLSAHASFLFSFSSQMSSHDCFEMGRQLYLNSDYYHTLLWMNEAMARLNNNNSNHTNNEPSIVRKADILEYLAFSVFKQGKSSHIEMVRSHQR